MNIIKCTKHKEFDGTEKSYIKCISCQTDNHSKVISLNMDKNISICLDCVKKANKLRKASKIEHHEGEKAAIPTKSWNGEELNKTYTDKTGKEIKDIGLITSVEANGGFTYKEPAKINTISKDDFKRPQTKSDLITGTGEENKIKNEQTKMKIQLDNAILAIAKAYESNPIIFKQKPCSEKIHDKFNPPTKEETYQKAQTELIEKFVESDFVIDLFKNYSVGKDFTKQLLTKYEAFKITPDESIRE